MLMLIHLTCPGGRGRMLNRTKLMSFPMKLSAGEGRERCGLARGVAVTRRTRVWLVGRRLGDSVGGD